MSIMNKVTVVSDKPVIDIQWSEPTEPNNECPYNHVTTNTPFGIVMITWKGWKPTPSYDIDHIPWDIDIVQSANLYGHTTLDDAKKAFLQYYTSLITS